MASTITPTYTDGTSLIAITTLALNGVFQTTFSLNTKWGAWVFIWIGRGGTTALTNGVDIRIRRTHMHGR